MSDAHFAGGDSSDILSGSQMNVALAAQGDAGNNTFTGGWADDSPSSGEEDILSGGEGKDGLEDDGGCRRRLEF